MTNEKHLSMTFLDAPTGAGKTSAIVNLINSTKGFVYSKDRFRYIVVTPYKTEIERLKAATDYYLNSPEVERDGADTKRKAILQLIKDKKSIVCTHSLFGLLTEEHFNAIKNTGLKWYLIIDEEISCINAIQGKATKYDEGRIIQYSYQDINILQTTGYISIDSNNKMMWHEKSTTTLGSHYEGVFSELREHLKLADIFQYGSGLISVVKKSVWEYFSSIMVCGYRLKHSKLNAYCQLQQIKVEYAHIAENGKIVAGYLPLKPYGVSCVNVYTSPLAIPCSYSKTFYNTKLKKNGSHHTEYFTNLCGKIKYFKDNLPKDVITSKKNLWYFWTTYKDYEEYFKYRYTLKAKNFVPCNVKATNNYSSCRVALYLIDLYLPPNINNFLKSRGIELDTRELALSNLIQFIWRGSVRNIKINTPIDKYSMYVFIASQQLYNDFLNWQNK